MAREDAYLLGYMYGSDGLTIAEYRAMINQFLSMWSNEVVEEFVRGYHDHIEQQLHN